MLLVVMASGGALPIEKKSMPLIGFFLVKKMRSSGEGTPAVLI
jgi:hypothetical protein